jgi:hypothetical protein
MGAAAEHRGNAIIRRQLEQKRPVEFEIMDRLNAMPKDEQARHPFGPILFRHDGNKVWALDPIKQYSGLGFWYPTLREAVRNWQVMITEYRHGDWYAIPFSS